MRISMEPGTEIKGGAKVRDEGLSSLRQLRFAAEALAVYKALRNDGLIGELCRMLEMMDSERPDIFNITRLYSSVGYRLLKAGTGLKGYFADMVLYTENPFSRAAEREGAACLTGAMGDAVRNDLIQLQTLASIESDRIREIIFHLCKGDEVLQEAVMMLPKWAGSSAEKNEVPDLSSGEIEEKDFTGHGAADGRDHHMRELLKNSKCWPECAAELSEFHRQCGSGAFSKYRAFVWRHIPVKDDWSHGRDDSAAAYEQYIAPQTRADYDGSDNMYVSPGFTGSFIGVVSPDPVRFSDLISYELERKDIIENTLHFLSGRSANNILLYGDRGTGKSTTVKALVNEYHDKGLRMIEVPKGLLGDFPLIIRQLAGRSLKFILFVDDLAFEDNEENYTALKAALEGGLESKPDNILIYATSNRKHLIKERFSDRAGLASGNADDEVRAADTMQEKLSLSDRFGMTVIFSSPDKERYLEIVEGLAKNRGIDADSQYIRSEALKWELQYNGRSPRTARQFTDWLEGHLSR